MIYTIGVSFTAEMLMKAAYEETLGRVAVWLRGPERAELDEVSARQASDYARFLQQVPWYRWDFDRDRAELSAGAGFRNAERRLALGLEYRAKAAYARVIAAAVAGMVPDALRMRVVEMCIRDRPRTRVTCGSGAQAGSRIRARASARVSMGGTLARHGAGEKPPVGACLLYTSRCV